MFVRALRKKLHSPKFTFDHVSVLATLPVGPPHVGSDELGSGLFKLYCVFLAAPRHSSEETVFILEPIETRDPHTPSVLIYYLT